MNKSTGFAIIELLVVISIVLIFAGFSIPQFNLYTQQAKLKSEARKLVDVLELAKKKALAADLMDKNCTNFTGYRVIVSTNSYSLLFGCTSVYSVVQNYNFLTNITATVGTGIYNFSPLMNNPSFISNSITVKNSLINKSVIISISPIGIIELNETLL